MENETSRIEELEARVEALENGLARLNAEYYGRIASEGKDSASKPRIDFSEAYGETGRCVYHPQGEPTQVG